MVLSKASMNDFKKYIREKEKLFEARLKELESRNKYNYYIGQKFGTKTVVGVEYIKSGSKTRAYFRWQCDCGIEGISQKENMLNRTQRCVHRAKSG